MFNIFHVRCSLCPAPEICSCDLSPARSVHAPRGRDHPPPPAAARPAPCALLATPRQYAYAFNQPLSWDTSSVTDMSSMFDVRCAPHPTLQSAVARPLPDHIRGTRRPVRRPSYPVHPPCDSSGRNLPVGRQQAAHPLRVGGHPRLCLRWLWLGLGAGKLPLKPSPRCACGRGRVYGGCLYHSPQHMCVATTPTPT